MLIAAGILLLVAAFARCAHAPTMRLVIACRGLAVLALGLALAGLALMELTGLVLGLAIGAAVVLGLLGAIMVLRASVLPNQLIERG